MSVDGIKNIVETAQRYNQHVIPTLANALNTCDGSDYAYNGGKSNAYYDRGWHDYAEPWIRTIVPALKDYDNIVAIETINEPGKGGSSTKPSLAVWNAYLRDTTGLVKSLDPNTIVGMPMRRGKAGSA